MAEEARGPPHGLAGIVEDEVEARQFARPASARTSRRWAYAAGRGRGSAAARGTRRSPAPAHSARRHPRESASARPRARRRAAASARPGSRSSRVRRSPARTRPVRSARLLALGIVEVAAGPAHRIVVAMDFAIGLLADVAGAGSTLQSAGARGVAFATARRRQPQRRIGVAATLHAQPRAARCACRSCCCAASRSARRNAFAIRRGRGARASPRGPRASAARGAASCGSRVSSRDRPGWPAARAGRRPAPRRRRAGRGSGPRRSSRRCRGATGAPVRMPPAPCRCPSRHGARGDGSPGLPRRG